MNNYDDLRASTKKGDDTVVSIHIPKDEAHVVNAKKATVFSQVILSLKSENLIRKEQVQAYPYTPPIFRHTIFACIAVFSIYILLLLLPNILDYSILIPINLVFFAVAIPAILLIFFVEFNTRRNVSGFKISVIMIFGLVFYAIISYICDTFLITIIYKSTIDLFIKPVFWILLLFVAVFLFSNLFKMSRMPECFLIAVAFIVGYAVAELLSLGFNLLFSNFQTTVDGLPYIMQVIINEPQDLKVSLDSLTKQNFIYFFYTPLLYASLAVIVSSVVSYRECAKENSKPMVKSFYFLVLFAIFFLSISDLETNFIIFDAILQTLALVLSLSLAIILLNYCLSKECV